MSASYTRWPKK